MNIRIRMGKMIGLAAVVNVLVIGSLYSQARTIDVYMFTHGEAGALAYRINEMPVSHEELSKVLSRAYELDPGFRIRVFAEGSLQFDRIARCIASIRKMGLYNIGLVAIVRDNNSSKYITMFGDEGDMPILGVSERDSGPALENGVSHTKQVTEPYAVDGPEGEKTRD